MLALITSHSSHREEPVLHIIDDGLVWTDDLLA